MSEDGLPGGWARARLGEIVDDVEKVNPKEAPDKEFIYLDIASIDNLQQKITNPKKYLGENAPSRARQLVKAEDILFYSVRTYLKNIATVNQRYDNQLASTGFCVIRPYNPISKRLIFFLVQTDFFLNPLNKIQRGTNYPAVRESDVFDQFVPLPPLPEQRAITSKIEQLFSDLDNGIENFKKAQAQLKRYRQSVLKAACEGKLVPTEAELARAERRDYEAADVLLARIKEERKRNIKRKYIEMQTLDISILPKLPEGWLWAQAQDICNWITNGYTPKTNDMFKGKGEIPFIKVYNLTKNGDLDFSINPTFISKETHTKALSRSRVFPGDILMNIVGPPLGKVSIVPNIFPEWNINQAIVIYRPLEGYDRKFLCYSLLTENILSWAIKQSKATAGQFNITITICRDLPLPLPPLAEQRRIVLEVERRLSISDKMEAIITESLQKVESLRQSILKKAFEGKLLSEKELEEARSAPDWEPAEKLLERIKAEKNNKKTKVQDKK